MQASSVHRGRGSVPGSASDWSRGHGKVPAGWIAGGAVLMVVGCFGALLLLSSLFWIVLKGALVLAVLLILATRISARRIRPAMRHPTRAVAGVFNVDALRAVEMPAFQLIAAGTLLAVGYDCAGRVGLILAVGVCLGIFLRARVFGWP